MPPIVWRVLQERQQTVEGMTCVFFSRRRMVNLLRFAGLGRVHRYNNARVVLSSLGTATYDSA